MLKWNENFRYNLHDLLPQISGYFLVKQELMDMPAFHLHILCEKVWSIKDGIQSSSNKSKCARCYNHSHHTVYSFWICIWENISIPDTCNCGKCKVNWTYILIEFWILSYPCHVYPVSRKINMLPLLKHNIKVLVS